MNKTVRVTAFALGVLLLAGHASAQEPDGVARLKKEVELLKRENDVLTRENAMLKKDIEQLKAGGVKKPAPANAPSLSDILVVGAVLTGKTEHIGGPFRGNTGTGTMTITSRDGDSFTATNVWVANQDKATGSAEVKGTILSRKGAKWKAVDAPISNESVATLRPDGLYIETLMKNAKGLVIKGVWKVEK